jgi:hypothetical protein
MLREMASGRPVEVTSAMATVKKLPRPAFIAQQFGCQYADVRQGGGPQGNGIVVLIVPDPGPRARERATRDWARYPRAGEGVRCRRSCRRGRAAQGPYRFRPHRQIERAAEAGAVAGIGSPCRP